MDPLGPRPADYGFPFAQAEAVLRQMEALEDTHHALQRDRDAALMHLAQWRGPGAEVFRRRYGEARERGDACLRTLRAGADELDQALHRARRLAEQRQQEQAAWDRAQLARAGWP